MDEKKVADTETEKVNCGETVISEMVEAIGSKWEKIAEIGGIVGGVIITAKNMISIYWCVNYAQECSRFYGIDKRYFDGTMAFQDKLRFIFSVLILLVYLFILYYINSKTRKKGLQILSFLVMAVLLFALSISCAMAIINALDYQWLINVIDNIFTILFLIAASIVFAYVLTMENYPKIKEPLKKIFIIIICIMLFVYSIIIASGIVLMVDKDISDKKDYEVIDDNKVIVSYYEGKTLVMDCYEKNETLYIDKGSYYFIEMTNGEIKYKKYKDVKCE